jgi:hypothetical protein
VPGGTRFPLRQEERPTATGSGDPYRTRKDQTRKRIGKAGVLSLVGSPVEPHRGPRGDSGAFGTQVHASSRHLHRDCI